MLAIDYNMVNRRDCTCVAVQVGLQSRSLFIGTDHVSQHMPAALSRTDAGGPSDGRVCCSDPCKLHILTKLSISCFKLSETRVCPWIV